MLSPADLYHVGFVVADLDGTMAEMSATAGVTWGPRMNDELPMCTPEAERVVTVHAVYSREFPHLELETEIPGTIFTVSDRPMHHVGSWTDDLVAGSAALERAGMPAGCGRMGRRRSARHCVPPERDRALHRAGGSGELPRLGGSSVREVCTAPLDNRRGTDRGHRVAVNLGTSR